MKKVDQKIKWNLENIQILPIVFFISYILRLGDEPDIINKTHLLMYYIRNYGVLHLYSLLQRLRPSIKTARKWNFPFFNVKHFKIEKKEVRFCSYFFLHGQIQA